RPSEVGQWIKNGRSTTRATIVKNKDELVDHWWRWWSSLAPSWRKKDSKGRPAIGKEAGDWGKLVHPGANGMLTVLLPLVWWKLGEDEESSSESWRAAVHDVAWV
ncbi:hypothetical protein C8R47DRAFT_923631, partial [Mycena vitilis]